MALSLLNLFHRWYIQRQFVGLKFSLAVYGDPLSSLPLIEATTIPHGRL
ncbi:hypothetical protein [Pseudomonas fragariae (ex Marin et al. 2024)]|nr:hypothetical protein [Pseudomonas sp. 20]MDX9625915.1 hypothetical protein [Pseudomonas sp. 20]